MADPEKRYYRKRYAHEFAMAALILGKQPEWSPHDYEAFTYKNGGVSLVFYPHRTSAGNYHIRVRDNGSSDKGEAYRLMAMLDHGAGPCCTFRYNLKDYKLAAFIRDTAEKPFGWADQQLRNNDRK